MKFRFLYIIFTIALVSASVSYAAVNDNGNTYTRQASMNHNQNTYTVSNPPNSKGYVNPGDYDVSIAYIRPAFMNTYQDSSNSDRYSNKHNNDNSNNHISYNQNPHSTSNNYPDTHKNPSDANKKAKDKSYEGMNDYNNNDYNSPYGRSDNGRSDNYNSNYRKSMNKNDMSYTHSGSQNDYYNYNSGYSGRSYYDNNVDYGSSFKVVTREVPNTDDSAFVVVTANNVFVVINANDIKVHTSSSFVIV